MQISYIRSYHKIPISRYLSTSSLDIGGIRDGDIISSLDISVFSICVVMVLVSILLLAAAIRQVPCQTLPWLCANTVAMIMAMVSSKYIHQFLCLQQKIACHITYHIIQFTA